MWRLNQNKPQPNELDLRTQILEVTYEIPIAM